MYIRHVKLIKPTKKLGFDSSAALTLQKQVFLRKQGSLSAVSTCIFSWIHFSLFYEVINQEKPYYVCPH